MKRWVIAIVSLLGANVIATVVLAVIANDGSTQVIPGYYDKAVHYDDAIESARIDRELGWTVTAVASAGVVTIELRNASSAPLVGARVTAKGYSRATARDVLELQLAEGGDGRYTAATHLPVGWCDFVITAQRGRERFERRLSFEAR